MASYITNGKKKVGYETIPGRKTPSLVIWDEKGLRTFGNFRSLADADEWFMTLVEVLTLKKDEA